MDYTLIGEFAVLSGCGLVAWQCLKFIRTIKRLCRKDVTLHRSRSW